MEHCMSLKNILLLVALASYLRGEKKNIQTFNSKQDESATYSLKRNFSKVLSELGITFCCNSIFIQNNQNCDTCTNMIALAIGDCHKNHSQKLSLTLSGDVNFKVVSFCIKNKNYLKTFKHFFVEHCLVFLKKIKLSKK